MAAPELTSAGRDLNPRLYGFAGRSLGPLGHRRQRWKWYRHRGDVRRWFAHRSGRFTPGATDMVLMCGGAMGGVVAFAIQSGGCEDAERMGDVPLLLLHGKVRLFPDADHLMAEAAHELETLVGPWIIERFEAHQAQ